MQQRISVTIETPNLSDTMSIKQNFGVTNIVKQAEYFSPHNLEYQLQVLNLKQK